MRPPPSGYPGWWVFQTVEDTHDAELPITVYQYTLATLNDLVDAVHAKGHDLIIVTAVPYENIPDGEYPAIGAERVLYHIREHIDKRTLERVNPKNDTP